MGTTLNLRLALAVGVALGSFACSHRQAQSPQRRATTSIELHLNASADAAFPLFGPVRESEWAPDWSPAWIYPPDPRQTADGAVFTVSRHSGSSTWVMTVYDTGKHTVEYVNFLPGNRITEISITVRPETPATSIARVSYRVTALSQRGSAFVAHFAKDFPTEAPHWEKAINDSISMNTVHSSSDHDAIPVKPN